MIITKEMYTIATKGFPLKFIDWNGEPRSNLSEMVLGTKEECEYNLNTFDEPEEYQILKVEVTYEF